MSVDFNLWRCILSRQFYVNHNDQQVLVLIDISEYFRNIIEMLRRKVIAHFKNGIT